MQCAEWPVDWPADFDLTDMTPATVDRRADAVRAAGQWLHQRSGRRYGVCTGLVTDIDVSSIDHDLGVFVDDLPIRQITAVSLDGNPVADGGWHRRGQYVCLGGRTGRDALGWHRYDSVRVTYDTGFTPPTPIASLAVGEMAAQIVYALTDLDACRLPRGVVKIVRNNITISMGDPTKLAEMGRTTLPLVNSFLEFANPRNLLAGSTGVYSPDAGRHR